ncbi:SusC/RagA family TonB-linked outer membrane protein [Chitinophaga sp. sic0106]|uniref:SusC/RagA family TonB-linked outer membrane protein n=1 Tax=Chitinophaga sp. sic0106 TaxID=2854785 RepID=UPI001C45CAEB|nr:SusC/RagA family TonB-linked outer membrane protein [Chitinophaga sp. sic0106]MBV7530199.1 SusC/RagA family TonB-linked outer membrane protein [Chitinophaga sp. sic0106]
MNCIRYIKPLLLLLLLVSTLPVAAQERTITGTIKDQKTGELIVGATVRVKNNTIATTTSPDGKFTLKVPSAEAVVMISHLGYTFYETKAANLPATIMLAPSERGVGEVVVVGYGSKKKADLLGAIANIKGSEVEDLPVANLGSALINRVPGVSVSYSSGKPGSTTNINIRNSMTFPGSTASTTQPLYVIDGIIVNPTTYNQSPNPDFFENLDASQIEDITFLKDASAAIYGAAGAKGVVLITTKKGKIGKPRITYNGYLGTSTEAVKTKSLTPYQHGKMLNDGWEANNSAYSNRFSEADLEKLKAMPDRSWYDEFWKPGNVMRHTLNVSGGSDRVTFFAGGSYYDEGGNYGDIKVKKYSVRGSIDAKIIDGLTANISFSSDFNQEYRGTAKGANAETDDQTIRALYLTPKWVPTSVQGIPVPFNGPNPPGNWSLLGLLNSGNYTRNKSQGLSTNASLDYRPNFIKGLSARVQFGLLNRNNMDKQYYPTYQVGNVWKTGYSNNGLLYSDSIIATSPWVTITNNDQLSEGSTISSSYQLIGTLNYARTIGQHDFGVLVAFDQSEAEARNIFLTKTKQLVMGVDEFWAFSDDPTTVATLQSVIRNPQATQFAKRSYISRVNYTFANKYLVEFIGRLDASSNFAPDKRWGFFPTVGLGWRVSEEDFFRDNVRFIDNLKLRAMVGVVGEDRVSNKTYVNRFTQTTGMLFGSAFTNGLDPSIYPNPAATWEKARTVNVGFDLSMLRSKLNITADFYHRYTYDAFNQLDVSIVPMSSGLITAVQNYGRAISYGAEFGIGYRDNINRDWGFSADVNFAVTNSMILQQYYSPATLGLFGEDGIENPIGKNPKIYNGNNFGYIATGILRSQDEVEAILAKNPNYTIGGQKPQVGFMNYEDVNHDGKIDDNDITLMYDRTAPIVGFGITLGVTYRQFKLQTNLNLSIGGKAFYDSEAKKAPTTTQNAPSFWNDHWTPENPNAKYPRADAPLIKESSTFWAVNGTQCRINNAVLSYALPKDLVTRWKIPDLRVMVTGTNLWSIVNPLKYKDPYTSNFASYPTLRTISVGIGASL